MQVKKEEPKYPSLYGSHAVMVDSEMTEKLNDEEKVVCRDDGGTYITLKSRLDNGLADPNRHSRPIEEAEEA